MYGQLAHYDGDRMASVQRGLFQLSGDLVAMLDWTNAITDEAITPTNLLPSQTAEVAVLEGVEDLAEMFSGICESGYLPAREEIVWASKSLTTFRPASALPIRERIVYRGLAAAALAGLDLPPRTTEAYTEFENKVLGVGSVHYVVIADVASFYQYVEHGQLETAIVESTGRASLARSLHHLLDLVEGGPLGLPQGPSTSDLLSELVLQPIERRLRRRGLVISRYSDDFRVGVSSWEEGVRAVQALQSELMPLGLVLNDDKTNVLMRATYESHLEEVDQRVEQAFQEYGIDPGLANQYSGDEDDADIDPGVADPAFGLLTKVLAERPPLTGFPRAANSRIIAKCFSLLGRARSDLAFGVLPQLMQREPPFARSVANYLARVLWWSPGDHPEVDPGAVAVAIQGLAHAIGAACPPWQAGWLFQPLLHPEVSASAPTLQWLEAVRSGPAPSVIRARACLALACQGQAVLPDLTRSYDGFSAAAQPDVVAAIAIAQQQGQDPDGTADVYSDSRLNTLIRDRVGAGNDPRQWLWKRP
jgi:hypothetical protein